MQVLNAAFPPRPDTTAIGDKESSFCREIIPELQLTTPITNILTRGQGAGLRVRVESPDWTERRAGRDKLRGASAVWKGVISGFVPAAVTWCAPRSAPRLGAALLLFSLMQRSFCARRKGTWENFKGRGTRHQSLRKIKLRHYPQSECGALCTSIFFVCVFSRREELCFFCPRCRR